MQNESRPLTTEVLIQENKGLQKSLDEAAKHLRNEKASKTFWKFFTVAIVVIVCIQLYKKKSGVAWLPVADSQQMCVIMSDWWGLKVQTFYPVWRKPTGETGEYSEQWCIKYPDNTWQVFYGDHGGAYKYPLTNSRTYF